MKRSFSALFVLLTALSGPLVVTPPAISEQAPMAAADDSVSRSSMEANQPSCLFLLDSGEAPEDLVVAPDDFDYEIYSASEYCEMEHLAASEPVQNDAPVVDEAMQGGIWIDEHYEIDNICLPYARLAPTAPPSKNDPWIGPAVAGISEEEAEAESAEISEADLCEFEARRFFAWMEREKQVDSILFGRWAVNLYEQSTCSAIAAVRNRCIAIIEEVQGAYEELVLLSRMHARIAAENAVSDLYQSLADAQEAVGAVVDHSTQAIGDSVVMARKPTPGPKAHCEFWELESAPPVLSDELAPPLETLEPPVAGPAREPAAPAVIDQPAEEWWNWSNTAETAEKMQQDDAFEHQDETSVESAFDEARALDLGAVQEAAEHAWSAMQAHLEILQKWSKEYEFKPNFRNERFEQGFGFE